MSFRYSRSFSTTIVLLSACLSLHAQTFTRSELPTELTLPFEMTYGPDGFLWLTEKGGRVSRVDPVIGDKTVIYTAPDYFDGNRSERLEPCGRNIGSGTFGLALHPDFLNSVTSYIYFVYSYNSGTAQEPATLFKIVRLTWDAGSNSVTENTDLVTGYPNGYDHFGGRLIAIRQNGKDYLYFSTGDNGLQDRVGCYDSPSDNPNNFVQDPNFKNGKVHRFNIDGTIPEDNPIPGNSFFTRGNRNPQGLLYNPDQNILYDVEHGDDTDDEINILEAGMNYGWKNVRGYHGDDNIPGEADFVSNYVPHPDITNDALKEPLYSWCTEPVDGNWLDWCTVAPSDGIYYGHSTITEWTNSLLVVTLKDGRSSDKEVYQFKLNPNGLNLTSSTPENPNPQRFFGADQKINGRLRDITVSPDGTKIYLISNKIIVYSYSGGTTE